jgi:uncharacterized membrane protein YeaQ/YmgE (transglycosylase-associated protein family)
MFSFLGWLIIGLIAGGLARFLIPGRQPMGLFVTMVLGLVGSIVGGMISAFLFGYDPRDPGFHAGGLIMSTIGAVLMLAIYLRVASSRLPQDRLPRA